MAAECLFPLSSEAPYLCGICNEVVTDDDQALQCEGRCQTWFHCKCCLGLNLTVKQYSSLGDTEDQWICLNCSEECTLPRFNSITGAVDVFHFDFQQNLPTPKLTVGKQFYMRLLWTYLFGIFCASSQITCAFMWHELIAHKGANDVVSSLARFLFHTRFGRTGAKESIWWADNCKGQNKNHVVVWFFQDLVRRGVYTRIDYKFLVVGHTYGPTDRAFGVIEKHFRQLENVYTPEEWNEHVRGASISEMSRVEVFEMEQEYFRNYKEKLGQLYTTRDKDIEGNPLEFSKVVWFNFGVGEEPVMNMATGSRSLVKKEHPYEVWLRSTYDPYETPRKVSFYKKSNVKISLQCLPSQLYNQYPLPIKAAKAADLKKLASQYVPSYAKDMYMNLATVTTSDYDTSEDSD